VSFEKYTALIPKKTKRRKIVTVYRMLFLKTKSIPKRKSSIHIGFRMP
jgi:hypothetical protein